MSSTPCRYEASIADPSAAQEHRQTLEILIDRWSSSDLEERLVALLATSSQRSFLDALTNAEAVGAIVMPGGSSYAIHDAREHILGEDARQVIVSADRRIRSWTSGRSDANE